MKWSKRKSATLWILYKIENVYSFYMKFIHPGGRTGAVVRTIGFSAQTSSRSGLLLNCVLRRRKSHIWLSAGNHSRGQRDKLVEQHGDGGIHQRRASLPASPLWKPQYSTLRSTHTDAFTHKNIITYSSCLKEILLWGHIRKYLMYGVHIRTVSVSSGGVSVLIWTPYKHFKSFIQRSLFNSTTDSFSLFYYLHGLLNLSVNTLWRIRPLHVFSIFF